MSFRLRLLLPAVLSLSTALAQQIPASPEQLQALLRRFPEADTDKDGTLSPEEAIDYTQKLSVRRTTNAAIAPAPTAVDVAYGPHARNLLDFWQPVGTSSGHPAPVVVFIHAGGFISGDKSVARRDKLVQQCLDAGVAFVSINYRYLGADATLPDILHDCARAIQFVRSKADDWHLDKTRVAAYGQSGGASAALWLAFHPDLADPKNSDPILRESTRLVCAGAFSTQFSFDMVRWNEVFGADLTKRLAGIYTTRSLYGLPDEASLQSPEGKRLRADCDTLGLITKDAPPVFLSVDLAAGAIINSNQLLHHPRHSQLLYDRCRELGVPVVAHIPALSIEPPATGPRSWRDFLLQQLKRD